MSQEQKPEVRIVSIHCRARAPGMGTGEGFSCDGKQAKVVKSFSNHDGDVGGGAVTTFQCTKCNRKFVITT